MKPKTKKSIVLFAALALVLGFAAAELQKSVRVVVSTGTAKGQPDVAYDAQAERYLVVWQERAGSGDDRDIRARVVNRDGTPASDIVALASSGEDERLPKTAATGSSSWTVVWSTGTSIEACTVDATGKATDFRTVDAASARPVDRPDIGACSSDGAFLVVWEELDETGLTVIKGRRIRVLSGTSGEEFLLARSPEHDLRNPSVSKSGSGSFVAWEKPVELRRADIEGRFVPADAASSLDLGQVLTIAADGARNTVPSVTAYPETDAYLVVWQSSDSRRTSNISFASVTSLEVQSSGKLTDTPDFRETRPFASSVGIAGRALITYQTAPSNTPLQREIAARTIGWGDAAASAEIVLDPTREGGGNPAAVPASGAGGRGLVVWDVKEGEGSNIYSREWLASELTDDGLLPDIDGPIVPLADVTVSGVILFNGLPQAGVLLSGFPIETRTDATGAYSGVVAAPWDGTVTPVQPGFTFSPPSNTYADVNADVTGQNYTATYVGGAEDSHEDNEDFSTAVELPLGTTHDLVLNDVDWFKFLVPASEAGKDLRIRLRGTGFPDTVNRRDLDFAILDASGKLLHYNVSGGSDETAYICDAVEGYYYIVQTYIPIPAGIVYSVTAELSDTFGLSYITGHVTDNYGMPLEGIVVELYDVLPDWWTASHPLITTDADGYYKFGWVPGNYTLRFNTYDFGNDGFDWTPDENYIGEMYNYGEVITLAPGSTVTDIDAELRPGGTITGTIVDGSGDPVNNARVYVFTSSVGSPGNVLTDGTGTYLIDRIWAGNYALRLRTTVGPIFNEWYDDRIQFASADPVEVSPEIGATAGVDAKFEERNWGTITGRVTNMSENPVGGLRVAIVDPAGVSLWTVQTDPQGYYTLSRVPAGAWKIFFDTRSIPATSLVPVYFPGTPLISDAQTVQVQDWEITSGIDVVLPQAGNISGQILNNIGGVNVIAYDTASEYSWSVSANVTLTGAPVYTIPCLPPGTYKVLARPNQQGDRLPQWHPAAASFAAASPVTVTAGGMTSGIDITLAGGGALIQGQVTDIDGFGLAGVNVVAYDPSKRIGYASALSDEDGNYTIRQVPAVATPSSVKIHFNTDSYWLNYIAEYYNNRSDYNVADTVAVTNGETVTLLDAVLDYRPEFAVTTASLPDGEVAVAYSHQLMATGGRTFYHWSIQTGTLPDGLSLGANGLIMGTPTSTGVWPFTIEVSDSTLPERQSVIQAMTITIGAYTGEGYTISGTVTQGGSPLPGVVLDELPGDPVTSSTGTYVAVVEPGFWNIVTPVLAGYAFDPPFREYTVVTGNLSGQDYAASPGYRLSGTVTIGGAPLSGVRITGLPTEIRTDEFGNYSIMLPIGWGGTVIPVLSGFTFSPTYMNYAQLLEDTPAQDYTATYAGGGEDIYEDNDTFATAATVAVGAVIPDLVLNDQDWFKFEVLPGDAGKTLGVRLRATAFPNGAAVSDPAHNKDLDYGIMDQTGKLLTYSMSGSIDEVTFIPDIQPGTYTIGHTYMVNPGMVYSLYVTTAELLPVGKVTGRVTNEDGQGIDGITVQLFKLPFDWNDSHAMAITDADGFYKAAAFSGDYQIKVGLQDFDQNPNDGLPDGWVPVRNYLPNSYDHDKTVILDDGAPISADVTLEWAGAISGRITDEEGNPIQSARINAYLAGGIQASVAYTDADGNYELRHLRPANYALQFRPPAGSPLAREWYNDVNAMGASLPVPAVAETTTMGIDAVLETGGQISGYVRNEAGDPIQGVTAVALDPSGIAMQAANSQSDGSYVLNSLKEGSYKIVFNPANCYAGNFLFREYNSGEPVPVADGQTTSGIDAVMYPAGAIIGRLSDQDDDGLMNGSVQAFSASTGNMWAATIDYMGNYTIRNLPPDNYRIRFSYTFGSITNYPPKWYSNANSGTEAAVLTVSAGGTVNGINGVLGADGGGISGRVTNTVGGGIAGISVLAEDGSFGEFATSQALTDAFGYYTVQNVPTGTARVFFQPGFRPFNAEFYNDQTSYGSAAAVPIEEDYVQPEINAVLTVRPSLALSTTSLPDGELGAAYAQTLAATGGFAFYHWSIYSGSLPPGLVLNSRGEISGTPTMQGTFHFMVDLTDSSYPQQGWTSELSITVGEYTGLGYTVSGTVTADATPLAGVTMSGLPGSPATNPAGGYVAVVPSGWNGTVVPIRSGYAFTPASITYANVSADSAAQDYTAVAGFTISGTVTLDGIGQAGVVMAGLPGTPSTDAAGGYAVTVPSGWDGAVTPTLPGFTFAPASIPYTDVSADMTGQNFVSTYAGGVDDSFEDNDSFETAAVVPLGTTSGLVLRDEDWFKVLIPAEDAGKDLRVHIWGTSYPDQTTRRDLDFGILDAAGNALSFSQSGSPDETAFICDIAAGFYYIAHQYVGLEGTVYSLTVDTNEDYGLAYISGTIRDDGNNALPGVNVELYGVPFNWDVSRPLVITDAAGNYKLGWAPGAYQVEFNITDWSRAGTYDWLPDANYLGEVYNGGEVLTLTAGATLEDIDGQLTPGGAISGTVTDSFGNPFLNAWVYAYAGDAVLASYSLSNGDGHYVLGRLRTGNYVMRLRPTGDIPHATEWYDDAASFAEGMPVAVVAGATTGGIDATFGTPGSFSGRVTNELGDPIAGVQVTAYDPAGIALASTYTFSDGNYGVGRLPSGSFRVLFNAAPATTGNFVSEYYADQRYLSDGTDVEVTAGATTVGIDAVLALAGTISGQVTVAGGAGLSGVSVHAFDMDSNLAFSAGTDELGNYVIKNVPAANYKVRFRPNTGDWAVEWWGDKTNFTEADIVTVASGATVSEIDAEFTEESGWITGNVTNGLGAGIAGLTVVAQDMGREAAYNSAITDENGNYYINRLPTCQTKLYFNADTAHLNYVSEYHLDKADHASADAVDVTVGGPPPIVDAVLANRPGLTVTTDSLPAGELAGGYSAALAASGGRTLYHWSLESGSLPDGLTLNGRGEISGMPTMAGTFWFTVRVSDSTVPQQVTTKELSITVAEYAGPGYMISGTVTADATPLAGVNLYGLPGDPRTNASGGYVAVVPSGWTGRVTPGRPGYAFTPTSATYSNVSADHSGQDYTAVPGYLISGTVTLEGSAMSGVSMIGLPGAPVTNASGVYAVTVPSGWDGAVTPTLPGFTFAPASIPYTDVSADMTGQNFVSTYAGGVDDAFEDNDSLETAAVLPLGTTTGLIAHDEEWFKFYVAPGDAGKDLRVRIWGTAFPNTTDRRDIDFHVLDDTPFALSLNLSGGSDETAYLCDVAEGWYTIGPMFFSIDGMVYSISIDANEDFGLGYVEGTVRDDGGTPIPGVSVELYGEPFNWDVSRPLIYTDAAGHYRIGYAPGPYTVRFNLATAERDDLEWTPDANFLGEIYHSGEVLDVAPGATLSGIDGQLTPGGTITGTVTDAAGNPLLNIWVYAHAGDTVLANYTLTNAEGNYVLNRLRTGNYAMRVRPVTPAAVEWYEDAGTFAEAIPIPVVAGATTAGIDFSYGDPGSISGYVRNGSGDPISGITVNVYDQSGIAIRSGTTDATGYYFIGRLPTGAFKVQFSAAAVTVANYVSEYYTDQLLLADATPVSVTVPNTTTGIDAVLDTGGTITGNVTSDGNPIVGIQVHAFAVASDFYLTATTNELGSYTIRNVPAGDYKVRFRPTTGNLAVEWYGDKADYTTANTLAVDVGQDVTGVDADLSDVSATITGRVTDGLGAGIAGVTVVAQDTAKAAAYSSAITDGDGNYSMGRLPTCLTKVFFNTDPAYLKFATEYYNDKLDQAAADAVSVTAGEITSDIDAMLSDRPALVVTTETLPAGELAVGYGAALAVSGGRTLYHWSLESGSLPDGLTLNGRGEISGTPTIAGIFALTVRVSDSTVPQQITTKELSITVGSYTGLGHTISGKVLLGGLPLAGATIGGLPGTPVTNSAGGYVAIVTDGWTGTATPVLAGYVFNPVSYPYSNVTASLTGQDFVASLGYTISGIVSFNAAPLEGVLMDGLPGSPLTDTMGYYAAAVTPGWSGTVTPTLEGYSFTPESVFYESVLGDQTSQDYAAAELPPPGKLRWFVKDVYGYYLWMNSMLPDESFEGWLALQGGTSTAAATAVFNGDLHIIVKDAFSNILWHQSMDSEGAWSGWTQLGGESPSTPSMAVFNNKLYVAIQEPDNRISCKSMDAGGTWSEWTPFPGATSTTPVLASFNGKLHLVVKDLAFNFMWWNSMDATETWSGWQQLTGESPSPVAMAEYNDKLYMFVRGNTNDLYFRSMDTAGTWGSWTMMVGATSIRPTVAAFNGRLYLVVKDANGYYIWMRSMDETETFGDWTQLPGGTVVPIALAIF